MQPPPYTPSTDFNDDELNNRGGRSTVATDALDTEFAAVALSVNAIEDNLELIQRDDGQLRDQSVHTYTLDATVLKLVTMLGGTVRGAWVTATLYALKDIVTQGGNTYIAAVAHTSGVFATDLAAVRWILVQLGSATAASGVPFSPTATISATNVQSAIDEADTENRALSAAAQATANAAVPTATLASSSGSLGVGVIQSGTGAILRNVQAKTRDQFDARDYGADPASSAAVNKAALQLAITAAAAYSLSSGNTATVTIRDAYGFKIDVRSTWPDVTGVAVPIVIKDYSKGVSYAGYPTAYDGSQERIFMFTPQPPTNNHDGNTIWLRSTWAPNWCISTDADYTGARTAVDNRRASFTLFVNGTATYRMGQGTLASATLTDEELSNFIIEKYARAGDTLTSAWGMFLGERKTHRMSYGGGSNAPLAAHDFFPGNTAETLDLALFRTPGSATTISLQSSAGVNARTYLRNNGGISEFGTQTGGAAIKLRQADRFAEFGAGATYTYHHNFQDARASNWIFFVNNTSATDGFVQRLQSASAQAATWSFVEAYANAGADLRFRIAGTGNVTNANNSYGAISDIKVKRDVTKVAPGKLAKVMKYEVVNFVLKDDPSNTKQIGFIAQQVREVAPGLVEEFPDFDDDHKPLGTVTLGVKHSIIATEHFAAFQEFVHEMRAEIASLKAELSAQKNTGGGATTQDTGGGTKPTTPK